jgi:hypothetical protein
VNYLNILWLAYGAGLLALLAIAGFIHLCGHHGKTFRAFLVAPAAGFIVFWLTHAIYLLVVKVPVAPSHRDHEPGDFVVMLYNVYSFLFEGLAPSLAYKIGLYCDPILYGGLATITAFIASFFFACRPPGFVKNSIQT